MLDLEKLSKENNVTIDEIQKVIENINKKYINVFSRMTKDQQDQYVDAGVLQYINRYKELGLEQFNGIILTFSQPKDGIQKKRKKAIDAYIENPEEAIKMGVVQELKNDVLRVKSKDGLIKSINFAGKKIPSYFSYLVDQRVHVAPLDNKESWPSGKKNFNYLKPLPLQQFFTNISGQVLRNGKWKAFMMTFNTDEFFKLPMNAPVKFYAKIREEKDGYILLGYNNKHTKFESTNENITEELRVAIDNFYDSVPISQIEPLYNTYTDKNKYDIIAITGIVNKVWEKEPTEDKPNPWNSIVVGDATSTIKVLFHPNINVSNIEEGSFIKLWGSISKGKKWDSTLSKPMENEYDFTIFGTGYYVMSESQKIDEQIPDDNWEE